MAGGEGPPCDFALGGHLVLSLTEAAARLCLRSYLPGASGVRGKQMKRALFAFATLLSAPVSAFAEGVIEPETCVLDALKSGALKENAYLIQFNCMKQYVRAVERTATKAPIEYFSSSTMVFNPQRQAEGLQSAST